MPDAPISPEAFALRLLALAEPGARRIVALAGPPGAGKSTLADTVAARLEAARPGCCAVLSMDGFHLDDAVLVPRGWRARKGAPHTFDVGGLAAMLRRLRENAEAEIAVPVFDRAIETARAGARMIPQAVPLVLVEGNWLLLDEAPWPVLRPYFDVTAMLRVPRAEIARRLTARWQGFGLSAAEVAAKVGDNDLPNADRVMTGSAPAMVDIDGLAPGL